MRLVCKDTKQEQIPSNPASSADLLGNICAPLDSSCKFVEVSYCKHFSCSPVLLSVRKVAKFFLGRPNASSCMNTTTSMKHIYIYIQQAGAAIVGAKLHQWDLNQRKTLHDNWMVKRRHSHGSMKCMSKRSNRSPNLL